MTSPFRLLCAFVCVAFSACDTMPAPVPSLGTTMRSTPVSTSTPQSTSDPGPTPTRVFPPETIIFEPQTGGYRVTTTPPLAPANWQFRFVSEDGSVALNPEDVVAGTRVSLVGNQLPGTWRFTVNDILCFGSLEIVGGSETSANVAVRPSGECQITVTGMRELFP